MKRIKPINLTKGGMLGMLSLFLGVLLILSPTLSSAKTAPDKFPRLGNFYLRAGIDITPQTVPLIARYDLVVLPAEAQFQNPDLFIKLRAQNSDIVILAYVPSTSFNFHFWTDPLHQKLLRGIREEWWLRDSSGARVSIWPGTQALNITTGWAEHLARYAKEDIFASGLWDGIVFDEVDDCASCKNSGNIDLNLDGVRDAAAAADPAWRAGVTRLLRSARDLLGPNAIIMTNGNSRTEYQPHTNGRLFESFPTPWEQGGTWSGVMESHRMIAELVRTPRVFLFGADSSNTGIKNFKEMRFGLGSALLAGAYFNYDYGTEDHGQLWWFDEYDVFLGKPTGTAVNLENPSARTFAPAAWRRDFEKGIVVVNAGQSEKSIRLGAEFEKLRGAQDPATNDGAIVSRISLASEDARVLRRITEEVRGQSFTNGAFTRIFDKEGQATRSGFFLFDPRFNGGVELLKDDLDADGLPETVVSAAGIVTVYRADGGVRKQFAPYGPNWRGSINIAVGDINGNGFKEIATGAGFGGGPHVLLWNADGRLLHPGFFPFDPKLRGGVDVALGDLDGDGKDEIIAGVGRGELPLVRAFGNDARLTKLFEITAYDSAFRGGINIAAGDLDGDGKSEIVTGANRGGGPHVRIFNSEGKTLGRGFFGYDQDRRNGVEVGVFDIDGNGQAEILALTTSVF